MPKLLHDDAGDTPDLRTPASWGGALAGAEVLVPEGLTLSRSGY